MGFIIDSTDSSIAFDMEAVVEEMSGVMVGEFVFLSFSHETGTRSVITRHIFNNGTKFFFSFVVILLN